MSEQRKVPRQVGFCVYDPFQYASGRISSAYFNTSCGRVYVGKYNHTFCDKCRLPIAAPEVK